MFNPAASPMDNNIQFDLRELIRAAEMSGINPQQIPGDANPWSWDDSRAMSWRSNFRALNPAVAQQAGTLLGGPSGWRRSVGNAQKLLSFGPRFHGFAFSLYFHQAQSKRPLMDEPIDINMLMPTKMPK